MSGTILAFSEDITNAPPPVPLPVGPYPAEIIGAQKRMSSTGNEYVQIGMRINPEAYPADFTDGDPDGTTLFYNRLLVDDTPANRHRWRVFMEKCGGPLGRNILWFEKTKDLDLPKPEVRLEVIAAAGGAFTVKATAAKLARDVFLNDAADGFFSDNYFDLLPGETATVSFKPSAPATLQSIQSSLRATTIADTY